MKNYIFQEQLLLRTPFKSFKAAVDYEKIEELITDPGIREALFLSSPSVLSQIDAWREGNISPENEERLRQAIQKYLLRMHSRSTPFGLMAGCTVLNWGDQTNLTLKQETHFSRHTRLDMHYWGELLQYLTQRPAIQKHLRYYPNTSLYVLGDKIRYVEYEYRNGSRKYHICSVDYSEYLHVVLEKAAAGIHIEDLVEALMEKQINREDAAGFVEEIIQSQVLVSELEPSVTGAEYMEQLMPVLKNSIRKEPNEEISNIVTLLESIGSMLSELDENRVNPVEKYYAIIEKLKQVQAPVELDKLFQVDLYKSLQHAELSKTIQRKLFKTLTYLERIPKDLFQSNLSHFKKRFIERFESREVPLLEVLDNETGIGYLENQVANSDKTPLIADIRLNSTERDASYSWNQWEIFLHHEVEKCIKNKHYTLNLTDEILSKFNKPDTVVPKKLPDTLAVMFSHVGEIEGEEKLLLYPIGISSAANLLGRFACNNKAICDIVQSITNSEKALNPDAILAEIVHLPESRIGNILHRPAIREYEIPYLAKAAVPAENQLPLSDLLVSVKNDRIILWSKKHNKEVFPRLTSAHNYFNNAQPIYQFLCELQNQGKFEGLYFSWGSVERMFAFLPRVEYNQVIVSPATWSFLQDDYQSLLEAPDTELLHTLRQFRETHGLPQQIAIVDADNHLLIDLEDLWSIKLMVSILKKRPFVKIIEFLFNPNTTLVRDTDGNPYANQFIATLVRTDSETRLPANTYSPAENIHTQCTFSLGSEWLYYKAYCGYKTADRVLTEAIKPLSEILLRDQLISQWFFIRYADPESHVRVRFKLLDISYLNNVIQLFREYIAPFEEWELVWKIQADTYKRELERYGITSITLAEELFFHDSTGTVNMLDLIEGDEGEEIRWQYATRAIDELLDTFKYTPNQRRDLLENLMTGFGNEFGMNRELKKQVDKKFRLLREKIETVLDRTKDAFSEFKPLLEILEIQKSAVKSIADKLLKRAEKNTLEIPLNSLLSSYIHMLMNRVFRSKQRVHELIIYDFMYRYYQSVVSRAKNKTEA